jgi:hypothetical protein
MSFLLIEGLDLAGKTASAAGVVRGLKARGATVVHRRNVLTDANLAASFAEDHRHEGTDASIVGALYVGAHAVDLITFGSPASDTVHLQESCWLRGIALHGVLSHRTEAPRSERVSQLWAQLEPFAPLFDKAVFLTASLDARHKRLGNRPNADDLDRWVVRHPDLFLAVERELRVLVGRYAAVVEDIDTSNCSVAHVVDSILNFLDPSMGSPGSIQ